MRPAIEIRHLRAFAAVAEERHFTRAAARLHVAQQALSAQIRRLESELGVELFRRTTRPVQLTAAGELFQNRVAILLADLDDAVDRTRERAGEVSGSLTIGYTPTVAGEDLPIILAAAGGRAPGLNIITCETWTPETVSGVLDGRFDAAFCRCPVVRDDVESITIRHEPLGVILGESHPLTTEAIVSLSALDPYALVIWPRRISPGFFDTIVGAFPAHARTRRIHEIEHFGHDTCFGDVAARASIAGNRAFFATVARHYDPLPRGFVWRPLDPPPLIGLDLLFRSGHRSGALEPFLDAVLASAREQGWMSAERPASPVGA